MVFMNVDPTVRTLEEVERQLIDAFDQNAKLSITKMFTMMQEPKETVAEWEARIRNHARKSDPSKYAVNHPIVESQCAEAFEGGLLEKFKTGEVMSAELFKDKVFRAKHAEKQERQRRQSNVTNPGSNQSHGAGQQHSLGQWQNMSANTYTAVGSAPPAYSAVVGNNQAALPPVVTGPNGAPRPRSLQLSEYWDHGGYTWTMPPNCQFRTKASLLRGGCSRCGADNHLKHECRTWAVEPCTKQPYPEDIQYKIRNFMQKGGQRRGGGMNPRPVGSGQQQSQQQNRGSNNAPRGQDGGSGRHPPVPVAPAVGGGQNDVNHGLAGAVGAPSAMAASASQMPGGTGSSPAVTAASGQSAGGGGSGQPPGSYQPQPPNFRLRGPGEPVLVNKNTAHSGSASVDPLNRKTYDISAAAGSAKFQRLMLSLDSGEPVPPSDNSDEDIPPRTGPRTDSESDDSSTIMTPPGTRSLSPMQSLIPYASPPSTSQGLPQPKYARWKKWKEIEPNCEDKIHELESGLPRGKPNFSKAVVAKRFHYNDELGIWMKGKTYHMVRQGLPIHRWALPYADVCFTLDSGRMDLLKTEGWTASSTIRCLVDSGAGGNSLNADLVRALGWTDLIEPVSGVRMGTCGESQSLEISGVVQIPTRLGGYVGYGYFFVVEGLEEACIVGNDMLSRMPLYFDFQNKMLFRQGLERIIPTYVASSFVVSSKHAFNPMVTVTDAGVVKPFSANKVEIDISELPVGGTYELCQAENWSEHAFLGFPRTVIRRRRVTDLTCSVDFINTSRFRVQYSPESCVFKARFVCPIFAERDWIYDPETRKVETLEELQRQLRDPLISPSTAVCRILSPLSINQADCESLISKTLKSIDRIENPTGTIGSAPDNLVTTGTGSANMWVVDCSPGPNIPSSELAYGRCDLRAPLVTPGLFPRNFDESEMANPRSHPPYYLEPPTAQRSNENGFCGLPFLFGCEDVASLETTVKKLAIDNGTESSENSSDEVGSSSHSSGAQRQSEDAPSHRPPRKPPENLIICTVEATDVETDSLQDARSEHPQVDVVTDEYRGQWAEQPIIGQEDSEQSGSSSSDVDLPPEGSECAKIIGLSLAGSSASDEEKRHIWLVLETAHEVFARSSSDVGLPSSEFVHSIKTGETPPIRQGLRRTAPACREELKRIVKEMLDAGVIEHCKSPWASPTVLVKKKDGTLRFCVDYRLLNSCTEHDSYPMPRIDDTLAQLEGNCWFSSIDMQSGFWQVPMSEEDKPKTAFLCEEGLFSWNRMPFGMRTAPATFQRMMDTLLSRHIGQLCLVFFDDVIVFSRSFEEHMVSLATVLGCIRDSGLKIKAKKCCFALTRIEYLGHTVSQRGLEPLRSKIAKILDCPVPKTVKELRGFLGLCGYYRKFIPEFSTVAAPLYDRCTGRGRFKMSERLEGDPACMKAIATMKDLITSPPVLGFPVIGKPFFITTDASAIGMGAILSQFDDDGREYVIEFASKKLNQVERNYCVSERECYAVVWALRHFRPYIAYDHVTLHTDHSALKFILGTRDPSMQANYTGKYGRWAIEISTYNLTVEHRSGKTITHADALSRPPFIHQLLVHPYPGIHLLDARDVSTELPELYTFNSEVDETTPDEEVDNFTGRVVITNVCAREVLAEQDKDPFCRNLKAVLMGKPLETQPEKSDLVWMTSRATEFTLSDPDEAEIGGVLMHFHTKREGFLTSHKYQMVVPSSLRERLMQQLHCSEYGGHLGSQKILSVAERRYWWAGMAKDIGSFCRGCPKCEIMKHSSRNYKVEMKPIAVKSPFYRVGMDILGPFPDSNRKNKYVVILCDYFTKWPEAYCTENQQAPTIRRCVEDFIGRYGAMSELHTDKGPQMTAKIMKAATNGLGIRLVFSTPHHHESLGLVERFNKTFGNMLRCFVDQSDHKTWDENIPALLMAYRNSVHASTGQTPYFLVHGRDPVLPLDLEYGRAEFGSADPVDYSATSIERLRKAWAFAKEKIGQAQIVQKNYYDAKAHAHVLIEGDLVTLDHVNCPQGKSSKLIPKRKGLYRILSLNFPNAVIKQVGTRFVQKVHMNRLRISRQTGLFNYPDGEDDGTDEWFCGKCDGKYDAEADDVTWVECETCGRWFHSPECTGLAQKPGLVDVWTCDDCERDFGGLIY